MKYYILSYRSFPKGESGESAGSKYDLNNACTSCGTRAELIGTLYTKGLNHVKENFFYTLDGDLLISNEIYSALVKNGIILLQVSQVVDQKGNSLPFYHLNPRLSFPKLLQQSQGLKIEDQCPVCKQNGYFNDVIIGNLAKGISTHAMPLTFHYGGVDASLLSLSDIFHTWEHMGLSNLRAEENKVIRYARPLLIVSEKVKKALGNFKIKKLSFAEVIIHINLMEL
jgi:hypothetical protein